MKSEPKLLPLARQFLEDAKACNVATLDIRGFCDFTDFMIIASGTSNRHVKAMARRLRDALREQGYRPLGVEGEEDAEWILLDYTDLVIHLMQQATREFYDLESLWGEQVRDMLNQQRELTGEST